MTKHPSKKNVCFDTLIHEYGATDFRNALARFIANLKYPHLVGRQLNRPMSEIRFRFDAVPVFHKIKFTSYDPYAVGGAKETVVDSIHVQPVRKDKRNRNVPPRFDTAVINEGNGQETGVTGNLIFLFSISILLTPLAQGIELAKFEWYFRCLIMSSTNYFHHI